MKKGIFIVISKLIIYLTIIKIIFKGENQEKGYFTENDLTTVLINEEDINSIR